MTAGCTLCHRVFSGPAAGQVFEPKGQHAVQRYLTSLADHIREVHGEIAAQVELSALQYRGYLLMGYYRVTNDEEFNRMREETRHLMHVTTRRVTINNEELRSKASQMTAEIELDSYQATEGKIFAAMVELRDRLCETEPQPAILTV